MTVKTPRQGTAKKTKAQRVVFLLDVDNTLLDNDRVAADLRRHLEREVGHACERYYWRIFEQLRAELGYADYLGALQRYRIEHVHDHNLLAISSFLVNYPFANRLYPNSLDVVERCRAWGTPVILSDGDVVFQPRKVERSGLFEAVDGHVLIYIHKEHELDAVERRYPADHYVLVDDKLRILTAVKQAWGPRVTTVFPRQGHYAIDPAILAAYPAADITLDRIGNLLEYDLHQLVSAGQNYTHPPVGKKAHVGGRLTRRANAR
ncbi:HAD family hydrolase [Nitrospira defluvii]|uniref:Haloacid dehalogenase n=1 Tax=Nitrospira defluvii TaxID=330214 RepID=A0ABM8SAC9_9BACT|nr:HAD family hydrolase [Nitrospira defluvii]CAE6797395.1 Haloacid dehalogenase [Nitrospira defluvii]